eukprot:g21204.t1
MRVLEFAKETPSLQSCSLSSLTHLQRAGLQPRGTGYPTTAAEFAPRRRCRHARGGGAERHDRSDTWRIEINLAKSQVMEVHPRGVYRNTGSYYYGSNAVEVVHQYKYLGLTVTDLSWDAQHERALAKARKGLVALARLFARREISFAAKRAMDHSNTLGSGRWGRGVDFQ